MNKNVFLILILLAPFQVHSNETATTAESAWFMPVLTIDRHPLCKELLPEVQKAFLSKYPISYLYLGGQYHNEYLPVAGLQPVDYESEPDITFEKPEGSVAGIYTSKGNLGTPTIMLGGKKYYLHPYRHPGCGGACERYQIFVSDQANLRELEKDAPYTGYEYKIYKAKDKSFWALSNTPRNSFSAYRITEDGHWEKSCGIQLEPANLKLSDDEEIRKALSVLDGLESSVMGLMRDAGPSCGSMRTHGRWIRNFSGTITEILYRPWSLYEKTTGYHDEFGTYDKDLIGLKDWSLMGLSEYESFNNYINQLEPAINGIAGFYQKKFGWDRAKAEEMAQTAVTSKVSETIRFYYYEPIKSDAERNLRKTILEKKPIDAVKANSVGIDVKKGDGGESLLSIAVTYPEALKYLLESGLNPDHQNDFGKTPLMYAAQYNQYESAKLLLDAGADPNAKTIIPFDTCRYRLSTANMTPLHYAVRYASPEIVKLLLDNNAATFIKATGYNRQETALDWFERYTADDATERNPHIADEDRESVRSWLVPPDAESAQKTAESYAAQAGHLYQKNEIAKAYQLLELALALQPDNRHALSDMSIIALRNKKFGPSLEAGYKLITSDADEKLKANAWYNQGLACEEMGSSFFIYNNNTYCVGGRPYPFYMALKLHQTEARKEKLVAMLFDKKYGACILLENGGMQVRAMSTHRAGNRSKERGSYLFVLHDKNQNPAGEQFAWDVKDGRGTSKHVIPEKTLSFQTGDKMITAYETESELSPGYNVEYKCANVK